jgi:hypothetical protein
MREARWDGPELFVHDEAGKVEIGAEMLLGSQMVVPSQARRRCSFRLDLLSEWRDVSNLQPGRMIGSNFLRCWSLSV